jgi:hypothetical protein
MRKEKAKGNNNKNRVRGAISFVAGQKSVCTLATYQHPTLSRVVSPPVAYFFLPATG